LARGIVLAGKGWGIVMTPSLPDELQPYEPPELGFPPSPRFRWEKFLRFLKKHWWWPVITLLLGLGGALIYVWVKPPDFISQSSMWETVKTKLPEGSLFSEDTANALGTQTDLLRSSRLHGLVLTRLKADGVNIPLDKKGAPLPVIVRVSQTAKSDVFVLSATGPDAAYTKAYLDALMDAYLGLKKNVLQIVSGDTLQSITEQLKNTERDLKTEQDIFTTFERTNNLAILQEEGAVAGEYLTRLKTQLSDLALQARLLQAMMRDDGTAGIATNGNPPTLSDKSSLTGLDSAASVPPAYAAAFQELETLKIQREKLSRYLQPKHPKMVKLDEEIDSGQRLLDVYMRQSRDQFAGEQETVRLKIENVTGSIREWEARVVEANVLIAEADKLKLNVQRAQAVYDQLTLLVRNVDISRNIDQDNLSILESASAAQRSYSKELIALIMAGVGGLGVGVGLILLITVRDDRFNSVVEVTERLGDSVIGQVPEVPMLDGKMPLLLGAGENRHMLVESYRNLRSALIFMTTEKERPKVVLITSAVPNEGKSTVAANLAQTLALGGARVVLLDCDLRKGVLHELMGLQREPGLAEVLSDPSSLDQVIQTNSVANLAFISTGKPSANSGDLFLCPAFDDVLARLRRQFDYVLIDSSPVFATDDATTLAPKVDGTLFVVRGNYSSAGQVREALELLHQRRANILGLVFNRANVSARSYQYYKYGEYHSANGK
jgi:succinoglycan biosynthesis transport protein ExoP